eukprot:1132959-Rhodomonas_salina.1
MSASRLWSSCPARMSATSGSTLTTSCALGPVTAGRGRHRGRGPWLGGSSGAFAGPFHPRKKVQQLR